jgi:hypothetical protein
MAYTTIDNPELYFQCKTYTGTGSSNAFTLDGDEDMQPDLVWIKHRAEAHNHYLYDSVRGVQLKLSSNTTAAEIDMGSGADAGLTAFGSDGFTIGGDTDENASGESFVAWNWKAGDSNTSVSSSGSGNNAINACTHRANTTAGFSIIKYTGLNSEISNGQKTKVTHGLGAKPDFLIMKNRDSSSNWIVTRGIDNDNHGVLNGTNAFSGSLFTGNQNQSDSTHFVVGNEPAVNANGDEFIAYVFAEKKGFSKFGSFAGNNSSDGTFVYTGFRPAWVMIKRIDTSTSTTDWFIFDNKRNTGNPNDDYLEANENSAETTSGRNVIDFLSNGFKCRQAFDDFNASGSSQIYMAFAESPFVNSNGVPNNAR